MVDCRGLLLATDIGTTATSIRLGWPWRSMKTGEARSPGAGTRSANRSSSCRAGSPCRRLGRTSVGDRRTGRPRSPRRGRPRENAVGESAGQARRCSFGIGSRCPNRIGVGTKVRLGVLALSRAVYLAGVRSNSVRSDLALPAQRTRSDPIRIELLVASASLPNVARVERIDSIRAYLTGL